MDIVLRAKLASIVVTPGVDMVPVVDAGHVACAELNMLDWILEAGLESRLRDTRLEEWCHFLYASQKSGYILVHLNKAIGGPSAKRPPPKHQLIPLVHQSQVLTVACHHPVNVLVLQSMHRHEVFHGLVTVLHPQLPLNIQSPGEHRSKMHLLGGLPGCGGC